MKGSTPSTKEPINEKIFSLVCQKTPCPKVLPPSTSYSSNDLEIVHLGNTPSIGK
jgi:hypothetical protein